MNFSFSHPNYLFLLFTIPLMILIHIISLKIRGKKALKFANFDAIERIRGIDLYSKNLFIFIVSLLIVFTMTMSLSGLTLHTNIESSMFSFVIAIDTSSSMTATDVLPDRFEAAKSLAVQFVEANRPGTKFAVISFSGNSIIEQELTDDPQLVKNAIRDMSLSNIGGTDLPEAVTVSANILKNQSYKSVLLFSDGQINVGDLDVAITYAKDNKVVINTIGVGKLNGGLADFGISKLDEDSLKAVAFNTDGKYFLLESQDDVSKYFNDIMGLTMMDVSINLSKYLLLISIIFFMINYILLSIRYRGIP